MLTLLYLAFGEQRFFDEVLLSIISLRNAAGTKTPRIAVYTDKPDRFAGIPGLDLVTIPPNRIKAWMASFGYVYRIKILALRDCMDQFGGNVALIDGDTFFADDPSLTLARISHDTALMNCIDPGKHSRPACARVINASQDLWDELGIPDAPQKWCTWNSGVVGLHESHRPLLDQILYLNDALYARSGIRIVEQVAASIILQNHVQIEAMDKELIHYFWGKFGFTPQLKAFMEKNRTLPYSDLLEQVAAFSPTFQQDPKLTGRRKLHNSYEKRACVVRFRINKFLHDKDWSKDIELSRKVALSN